MKRLLICFAFGLGLVALVAYGLRAAPTYAAPPNDVQVCQHDFVANTNVATSEVPPELAVPSQFLGEAAIAQHSATFDTSQPATQASKSYRLDSGGVDENTSIDIGQTAVFHQAPDQPDHPAAVNMTAKQNRLKGSLG